MRAALPVLLALVACNDILGIEGRSFISDGGGGGTAGQSEGGASGGGAMGGDGGMGGGGAAPTNCPRMECDSTCVDPIASVDDCGACANQCATGDACSAGVCDRRIRSGAGQRGLCIRDELGLACMSDNERGEAGTGDTVMPQEGQARRVVVLPEAPAPLFSTTTSHSTCVLLEDGKIRCFGSNRDGEMGTGAFGGPDDAGGDVGCCYVTESVEPVFPDPGKTFIDIASSGAPWFQGAFLALGEDGDLYCWGSGNPNIVKKASEVVQVVAGAAFACALLEDGTVQCWGNPASEFSTTEFCNGPAEVVEGLTNIRLLGAGHIVAFAIGNDDSVYAWGLNRWGSMGPGSVIGLNYYPPYRLDFDFPARVTQIVGVHSASCARLENGEVYCWGENGYQGNGHPYDGEVDVVPRRADIDQVIQLAASHDDFVAVRSTGAIYYWDPFEDVLVPAEVVLP